MSAEHWDPMLRNDNRAAMLVVRFCAHFGLKSDIATSRFEPISDCVKSNNSTPETTPFPAAILIEGHRVFSVLLLLFRLGE
jgi:hypothetical protein